MSRLTARQRECLHDIEVRLRSRDPEFVRTMERLWGLSVEPVRLASPPKLYRTRRWLVAVTRRGRLMVAAGLVLLMTMVTLVVALREGAGRMPPRNSRAVQLTWWGFGAEPAPVRHEVGAKTPVSASAVL